MIPIHELLSRIHWDKEFGKGDFAVGYYDRVEDTIVRIPFREIIFEQDSRFIFQVLDIDGVAHTVPLHRIMEVYKNGELIWRRDRHAGLQNTDKNNL